MKLCLLVAHGNTTAKLRETVISAVYQVAPSTCLHL